MTGRVHLSLADYLRTALIGPRTRRLRTALSALGIGIGITALTAITGITASNQAQLLAELDDLGANLLVVRPGDDPAGAQVPLPESAPAMVGRLDDVEMVGVLRSVPEGVAVYRTDLVPAAQTNGVAVRAVGPDLLDAVEGSLAVGQWFTDTSRTLPVTVLGSVAAGRLGVREVGLRVWIGGDWYTVIGILESAGLAADIDSSAFIGDSWAAQRLGEVPIASVYVRAAPEHVAAVRDTLAAAANPASPYVSVSELSDLAPARAATASALSGLVLALVGLALLVGGISIANTMVIAVLERRGEIGLRRALGARRGQIASQITGEAAVLAAIGGSGGALVGVAVVLGYAALRGHSAAIPLEPVLGGLLLSILVGTVAGLYPAVRASRVSPAAALQPR